MASFTNDPLRYTSVEQDKLTPLPEADAKILNRDFDTLKDLGFLPEANNQVPKTGGVPRIFLMTRDEDGRERVHTLEEKNIALGSLAFWKEAQLGNVFAYPAGETRPVQLQVSKRSGSRPQLSYSKPLEHDDMPFHSVERPAFYKFWFRRFIKSWRDEVDTYNRFAQDKRSNLQTLTQHADGRRPHTAQEVTEAEEAMQVREHDRQEKERLKDLVAAQENEQATAKKIAYADAVYKPVPKAHSDLITSGDGKLAYFTQDQFNLLKSYDIKMDSIKAGPNKTPLTDEDFATIAFYSTTQQKYLSATRELRGNTDPYGAVSLFESGVEPTMEKAQEAYDKVGINFSTTDFFVQGVPRYDNGVVTEGMIQPAREETLQAFQAYAAGDKEPLAKLMAHAVNYSSDELSAIQVTENVDELGPERAGSCKMAKRLCDLMKKDPEMEKLALQHGMKKENLAVVKGAAKLCALKEDCLDAKTKLADAKVNNKPLSEEEKKKYVTAIVKSDIAEKTFIQEQLEASHKLDRYYDNTLQPVMAYKKSLDGDGSAPPKGKVWDHTATNHYSVKGLSNKRPPSLKDYSTPEGEEKLNMTVDEVIKREGLYQPNESPASIHERMKNHQYDPQVLVDSAASVKQQLIKRTEEPQPDKELVVNEPMPPAQFNMEL